LDLTAPLGSYLKDGDREALYIGIDQFLLQQEQPAPAAGGLGRGANRVSTGEEFGFGSANRARTKPASGDIEVQLGPALAAALGLQQGANLDEIGQAFVGLKYPGLVYTPGSAVVITEFEVTKLGAQNSLRVAATVRGAAGAPSDWYSTGEIAPKTAHAGGFFSDSGLSNEWVVALQDANGDVAGALYGLSSDQVYSKFIGISASSLSLVEPYNNRTNPQDDLTR
jgi:hypothetical protein